MALDTIRPAGQDGKKETIEKSSVLRQWTPYQVISFGTRHLEEQFSSLLPGYESCPVLRQVLSLPSSCPPQEHVANKAVPKDLDRFWKKLHRDGSFLALCVLAAMVVATTGSEKDKLRDLDGKQQPEWENHECQKSYSNQPDDEDDANFLVEGWPLIQDDITWRDFQALYRIIRQHLHMITLENPLSNYAKVILLNLEDKEFHQAVQVAFDHKWIPKVTTNRLQASQFFLDFVASLPFRIVGVLLEDPTTMTTTMGNNKRIPIEQSCLPVASIEVSCNDRNQLQASLIALYDLDQNETITVSSKPAPSPCPCFRCDYEKENSVHFLEKNAGERSISMAQRLAHSYFIQDKYMEAKALYQKCHDVLNDANNDRALAADMWHSIAAVELTQLNFIKAQVHWRSGSHYKDAHPGIRVQIDKQQAYGYFEHPKAPLPAKNQLTFETLSPGGAFSTPNMVSKATCCQLIKWAEQHASSSQWTTSRHYAVPTTDVPVHQVPSLLEWFVQWFDGSLQPLLRDQFHTKKSFYVHDAFLVRYTASTSSHFLPLHYDESTHSAVLALNDSYEGGGTYFYNLDQNIKPETGTLVSFRGNKMLHGGNVVSKGVRYILALFLYIEEGKDKATDKQTFTDSTDTDPPLAKRLKPSGGGQFSFGFF